MRPHGASEGAGLPVARCNTLRDELRGRDYVAEAFHGALARDQLAFRFNFLNRPKTPEDKGRPKRRTMPLLPRLGTMDRQFEPLKE